MSDKNSKTYAVKYLLLACLAYILYYYSFSDVISPTLKWILLAINILLLLSFIIWDYGIKKRKLSTFNRTLSIAAILITILFSIWFFR